jgi:hypothetical protein
MGNFFRNLFGGRSHPIDYTKLDDARIQALWDTRKQLGAEERQALEAEVARRSQPPDDFGSLVQRITHTNLWDFEVAELSNDFCLVLSPIWEPASNGSWAIRRTTLMTNSMRAHYFESEARDLLNRDPDELAAAIAARAAIPTELGELRRLYVDDDAPYWELKVGWNPTVGATSLLLADAARHARVGATLEEWARGENEERYLSRLQAIEIAFMRTVSSAPVDELVEATKRAQLVRRPRLHPDSSALN